MGLYDRDYYRDSHSGGRFALSTRSAVFTLIIINIGIWVLQVALWRVENNPFVWLKCNSVDVFERGYVWQLVTANFLHAENKIWHLLFNMVGLYVFGRDVEELYGKRNFFTFYLAAGVVAMGAESLVAWINGQPTVIVGASGAVMGLLVVFVLFYPKRTLMLFPIPIPVQAWVLCLLYALGNIAGAGSETSTGVAHLAHLAGGAFGLVYKVADLRWESIGRRFGGIFGRRRALPGDELVRSRARSTRRRKTKVVQFPLADGAADSSERDPISARIDELLDKIHREGKESLSEEELEFLRTNSQNYKSE